MLSQNTKQYLKSSFKFCLELYKILVGTFLTLTVPKHCGATSCSLMQNVLDTSLFHRAALVVNMVCFLLFCALYAVETRREKWCIQNLECDMTKSQNHLDLEIEAYPKLKSEMRRMNCRYKQLTLVCIGSQAVNIGLSGVDVAFKFYGFKSMTPFSTYVLVIMMKLYTSYFVSRESLTHERAYSAFLSDPKNYNCIEPIEI